MDGNRFDLLARSLGGIASRRAIARAVIGAALLTRLGLEAAAAKCVKPGKKCDRKEDKCCGKANCKGGRCTCKAGLTRCGKKCLACDEGQVCAGSACACPTTGPTTCNGQFVKCPGTDAPNRFCARKTNGDPVCIDTNHSLACDDCGGDADCSPVSGKPRVCILADTCCNSAQTSCAVVHV